MSTPSLNLTLPVYTVKPMRFGSLSAEQSRIYTTEQAARRVALLTLLAAISPELATPDTNPSYRSDISFSKWAEGTFDTSLTVGFIRSGPLEIVVKTGWRRYTFKRFKVNHQTGEVDPRIVEGLRELVATAKTLAENEIKNRKNTSDAHTAKLARFARAKEIVAANGLEWSIPNRDADTYGTLNAHGQSFSINGGTIQLKLDHIPVERLPTVLSFLKALKETP